MLILTGRLIKGNYTINSAEFSKDEEGLKFVDVLEEGLISICRQMDIEVPIWLDKNTNEFARYRKTIFLKDQFVDEVIFDKFEFCIN